VDGHASAHNEGWVTGTGSAVERVDAWPLSLRYCRQRDLPAHLINSNHDQT